MRGACPCPTRPGRAARVRLGLALLLLTLLPSTAHAQTITSVTPARQRVHELLAITGSGFGNFQPGADRVELSDGTVAIAAGTPYVWRDDFVQVRVPAGALVAGVPTPLPTGALHVRIVKGAATSNSVPFQALAGLDGFLPPFHELTQIGPDQTDVSTVLGNPNLNLARTKDGEVGDVDGDGLPDLIDNNSSNQTNGTHSVLRLNRGDGTFSAIALEPNDAAEASDPAAGPFATQIPPGGTFVENLGSYDADLVDLDNDGLPELVRAEISFGALHGGSPRRLRVLRNLGAGAFLEVTSTWLPSQAFAGSPDDLAHMDLNHDGFIDVAVAQLDLGGVALITLLFNQSGMRFAPQVDLAVGSGSNQVHDVFSLDANADGYPDVVAVNTTGPSVMFLSQGGSFAQGQTIEGSTSAYSGEAADMNSDGLDDFVLVGSDSAQVHLNRREAPGSFDVVDFGVPSVPPGQTLYDVELGDLNLDGAVDIGIVRITHVAAGTAVILLNDGSGSFQNATQAGATALLPTIGSFERLSADLLDFDQDGDLDLYLTGANAQGFEDFTGLTPFGRAPNQLFENELLQRGSCDVNADGRIDAADVLLAARIAGGSLTASPEMLARADAAPANRRPTDGVVTAADVLIVARAAKGDPIVVCSPTAVTP